MTDLTYLSDIELTDEVLEHYGVKGMKWGVRKFDNRRLARRRNITGAAKPISSPVRRTSTGTVTTQRTVSPSGGGARDASYAAQNRAKGISTPSGPVKAKAKTAVGGLLASASGSSKKKGSGSKSKKSEAQKAKEKAEKEAAKKKKQEEREAAKKKKEAEKAAKAAAKGSSSKEKSSSSKGSSSKEKTSGSKSESSKSSGNEEKLKNELESYKKQLADLAKEKQKTQISETYTKYLESLLDKSNKKSQLDKIDTEDVKRRWLRKKSGMRHDDMEDGAIMIFPEELKKPTMEELFDG